MQEKPKRRWRPRIRLRTLLALLTACCLLVAWLDWRVRDTWRVNTATARLEALGGYLDYPYELSADGFSRYYEEQRSPFMRFVLGYRAADLPSEISLAAWRGSSALPMSPGVKTTRVIVVVDDDSIEQLVDPLNKLPTIRTIDLSGTNATGSCCQSLAKLQHVREINLTGIALINHDLTHLAELNQLEKLVLGTTSVSEAAVQQLKSRLPNCEIDYENGSRELPPYGLPDFGLVENATRPH